MVPSIMASRPGPEAAKQPQTITLTYCLYDAIFYEMLCWFYAGCTMNFQKVQLLLYQSTERLGYVRNPRSLMEGTETLCRDDIGDLPGSPEHL